MFSVGDDDALITGQRVQKAGFANVGLTHDSGGNARDITRTNGSGERGAKRLELGNGFLIRLFGGSAVYGILQAQTAPHSLTKPQLQEIVRFACASAGLSTTKAGGISSVPDFDDVITAMKTI